MARTRRDQIWRRAHSRCEYCQMLQDLDVRPFLGLEGPRPGFTGIRVTGTVSSSNANEEQLVELCQYVQDTSPVRDIIANPVPVETRLRVV